MGKGKGGGGGKEILRKRGSHGYYKEIRPVKGMIITQGEPQWDKWWGGKRKKEPTG